MGAGEEFTGLHREPKHAFECSELAVDLAVGYQPAHFSLSFDTAVGVLNPRALRTTISDAWRSAM